MNELCDILFEYDIGIGPNIATHRYELIQLLLKKGIDYIPGDPVGLLEEALHLNDSRMVEFLLDHGAPTTWQEELSDENWVSRGSMEVNALWVAEREHCSKKILTLIRKAEKRGQ
jgi:hypothetical protein